jgi:predicted CXXCH cytochrome family protein
VHQATQFAYSDHYYRGSIEIVNGIDEKLMLRIYKVLQLVTTIISVLLFTGFSATAAQTGWLLNSARFHISAHGQISCQDCHSDVEQQATHPDPTRVNKSLADFFYTERCLECHDSVAEDLAQNLHGSEKVEDPESYDDCISCHHPHEQPWLSDESKKVDPDESPQTQCASCHEHQKELPPFSTEDEACMICHRLPGADDPLAGDRIKNLCFQCHADSGADAQKKTAEAVALIRPDDYQHTAHAQLACTTCHPQAAAYEHVKQQTADCSQCHFSHDEKIAHDTHNLVACEACHLTGVAPLRDLKSKRVLWKRLSNLDEPLRIHKMVSFEDESACRRCHAAGNPVGASAMILPAKSILCMPCHAATFSVGDTTTVLALIVFSAGMGITLLLLLSATAAHGSRADIAKRPVSPAAVNDAAGRSARIISFIKALALNVFLQKRLFDRSRLRWMIHGLIFFPMALRFLWGIVALTGSIGVPQSPWVWQLLDKNNALTAFVFDLSGVMILAGIVLALIRSGFESTGRVAGLPKRDRFALILIGSIVLVGFVLEGMRMAMTGAADNAAYAFVGFAVARLFSNATALTEVYGYVWYVHAVLTGVFVAYLPFSRLLHIILSPVVLMMNAAAHHK